jgi:hypothetical protein
MFLNGQNHFTANSYYSFEFSLIRIISLQIIWCTNKKPIPCDTVWVLLAKKTDTLFQVPVLQYICKRLLIYTLDIVRDLEYPGDFLLILWQFLIGKFVRNVSCEILNIILHNITFFITSLSNNRLFIQ